MKRISVFSTSTDAEATVQALNGRDIPATLSSEDLSGEGSITILEVDEGHMNEAVTAMEGDLGSSAIKCPKCARVHVAYPNQPENSPTAALVEKVAEKLNLTERTFFCHSCHYEWSGNNYEIS